MAIDSSKWLWLLKQPFAHRGLFDEAAGVPENSLAAIQAAVDAGFGVELDVQMSSDTAAMVFHDETLDRMTGQPGRVDNHSQDTLAAMTLSGTSERIPTLAQALAVIDTRVPVLIELKRNDRPELLEASVRRALEGYGGPIGVMSLDANLIRWFARWAPKYPRGLVADCHGDDAPRFGNLGLAWRRRWAKAQFLAMQIGCLPSPVVRRARQAGLPCLTWTARTPDQIHQHRHEVDGFIFEKPALPGLRPGLRKSPRRDDD